MWTLCALMLFISSHFKMGWCESATLLPLTVPSHQFHGLHPLHTCRYLFGHLQKHIWAPVGFYLVTCKYIFAHLGIYLVKRVKFIKIVIFGQNCDIWWKFWNLVKNIIVCAVCNVWKVICGFIEVICGFGEVICRFWEVVWVGEWHGLIRWVGRIDGLVGQVGG